MHKLAGMCAYMCADNADMAVELCMWAGILLGSSVCCEEAGDRCVCIPLSTYKCKTVLGLRGDSVGPHWST